MTRTFLARLLPNVLLCALALTLAACNGSDSDTTSAPQTGTLNLAVTDAPIDSAQAVVIAFTGIEIHGPRGTKAFDFDSPKTIDLLKYQGSNAAVLLDGATLDAGNYQWIRLDVDAGQSYITLDDGSRHDLVIPSGAESGLKLVSGITIPAGGAADFTIDFDLRKSINAPADASTAYKLRPALRLINNVEVGTIEGSVANTLSIGTLSIADATCGPTVYAYAGANAIPADVDTSADTTDGQPLASSMLTLNNTTGAYDYEIGFLTEGEYTLTVTCAKLDAPGQADTLNFSATKTVSVTANETTTADFD
ncbi:MAG TPA: DUF4382 domain-containing protein [Gammaproteobacteria bacterium]|jgi:hypothetical protein|nr:DUF4382 domain-containing protein [Gammaproteobacteria bacterium]